MPGIHPPLSTQPCMKTIGMLGGMSNQATGEYYRLINEATNARLGGWNTAEIIISSVNFASIERFVRTDAWDEAGAYLAAKAKGVERAGADLLICMSNTMHRVADAFTADLSIPFLHIADPTGAAIRSSGLQRVGILGTMPVMASAYLKDVYRQRFGIEVIAPCDADRGEIDRIIFDELVKGIFTDRSKQAFLAVVDQLGAAGAEGVILGCTEIFLLISQADRPDVPMFDTTALHVQQVVELAVDGIHER